MDAGSPLGLYQTVLGLLKNSSEEARVVVGSLIAALAALLFGAPAWAVVLVLVVGLVAYYLLKARASAAAAEIRAAQSDKKKLARSGRRGQLKVALTSASSQGLLPIADPDREEDGNDK